MSVTYVDFQGLYHSFSEARSALKEAESSLECIECLLQSEPHEWYKKSCVAQEELYLVHEAIQAQFGEEFYRKIMKK